MYVEKEITNDCRLIIWLLYKNDKERVKRQKSLSYDYDIKYKLIPEINKQLSKLGVRFLNKEEKDFLGELEIRAIFTILPNNIIQLYQELNKDKEKLWDILNKNIWIWEGMYPYDTWINELINNDKITINPRIPYIFN